MVMLLIWIALYSLWFWYVKDDLMEIFQREFVVKTQLGNVRALALLSPKTKEYMLGVIGILLFFLVGYLLAG